MVRMKDRVGDMQLIQVKKASGITDTTGSIKRGLACYNQATHLESRYARRDSEKNLYVDLTSLDRGLDSPAKFVRWPCSAIRHKVFRLSPVK